QLAVPDASSVASKHQTDTNRPEAPEIVAQLKSIGVKRTVILTGDTERAAHAIARQCGIDDYRTGLLSQQKLDVIAELKRTNRSVVMVGDGVNDAPALAAATTGVAMELLGGGECQPVAGGATTGQS
ncbi:MAG: HAD-IC family P-type ATPase, partial [Thermomicrobiales bacterium]